MQIFQMKQRVRRPDHWKKDGTSLHVYEGSKQHENESQRCGRRKKTASASINGIRQNTDDTRNTGQFA